METDTAWERWLAALGDPANRLELALVGRSRLPDWDMGVRNLPEHMLHAVEGGGHLGEVAGQAVRTRPGDMLWVPPRLRQELRCRPGPQFTLDYLRFTLGDRRGREIAWPPGEPLVRSGVAGAAALYAQLAGEFHLARPGREARIRARLVLLMSLWWRAATQRGPVLGEARREHLAALIAADPARRWSGAALARELGVSALHLARQVRATHGRPLRSWLVAERIRHAAGELLASHVAVAAVAHRYGYADLFLFSRQFRAVMGVAPRRWRAQGGS
jgi:AraC-like DNA-binding protein